MFLPLEIPNNRCKDNVIFDLQPPGWKWRCWEFNKKSRRLETNLRLFIIKRCFNQAVAAMALVAGVLFEAVAV